MTLSAVIALFLTHEPPSAARQLRLTTLPADHTPTPGSARFFVSPPHRTPPPAELAPTRRERRKHGPVPVASDPPPATTPSAAGGGFPASCVALHEESGHNSVAGYFGTIYPPSQYPGGAAVAARYGDSWLAVPYAAQLAVAEAIYAAYGSSAWGPLTRAYCW